MNKIINIITEFITKYFWVFFASGILAGIFLPFSSLFAPYILYMLMFVLFLSCLKINTEEIIEKIKDFKLIFYLVFLILIIMPLLIYPLFNIFLKEEYSLAVLILLTMPAGMAVPIYATLFKGDKELALIISVITSLLCPLTVPVLIYFLTDVQTEVNPIQMFTNLSIIIFIPFILSIIFRKIGRKTIKNTKKYYSPISILIISLIITGATSKANVLQIINDNKSIIWPFLSLFILATLLHLIGYYTVYKKGQRTKITGSLALAYMNSTLAIVFASSFFGPETILLVILYQIPTNLVLITFGYISKNFL